MRLIMLHPACAAVSCDQCEEFQYDDEWQPVKRGPVHCRRALPMQPTPCWNCPKIPPRKPSDPPTSRKDAVEISDVNFEAYQHWLRCRAVGRFPKDEIVERDAALIQSVQDVYDMTAANTLVSRFFRG